MIIYGTNDVPNLQVVIKQRFTKVVDKNIRMEFSAKTGCTTAKTGVGGGLSR